MALYIKGFSLVLKTVSKPLAKQLKQTAMSNPTLRSLGISAALRADALYQSIMAQPSPEPAVSSSGRRMKLTPKSRTTVMTEDQALSASAEFIGEFFIFGVAGGLVYWEQQKSAEKDAKKTQAADDERAANLAMIAMQQRSLRDLTELIRELETSRAMDAGRLEALETAMNAWKTRISWRSGAAAA